MLYFTIIVVFSFLVSSKSVLTHGSMLWRWVLFFMCSEAENGQKQLILRPERIACLSGIPLLNFWCVQRGGEFTLVLSDKCTVCCSSMFRVCAEMEGPAASQPSWHKAWHSLMKVEDPDKDAWLNIRSCFLPTEAVYGSPCGQSQASPEVVWSKTWCPRSEGMSVNDHHLEIFKSRYNQMSASVIIK